MLIFNEVVVYGVIEVIKEDPPQLVIELFDQDRVVSRFKLPSNMITS